MIISKVPRYMREVAEKMDEVEDAPDGYALAKHIAGGNDMHMDDVHDAVALTVRRKGEEVANHVKLVLRKEFEDGKKDYTFAIDKDYLDELLFPGQ